MEIQDFKGIWIPKEICALNDIGWTEKLLLSEIYTLSYSKECYANNKHFSKILGITKESVSRIISKLIKGGYLNSEIKYKINNKQIDRRILKINYHKLINKNDNTSPQNCSLPPCKNDIALPTKMLKKEIEKTIKK